MSLRFVDLAGGGGGGEAQVFFWTMEIEAHQFNTRLLLVKAQILLTKADAKGKLWKMNLGLLVSFGCFQHSPVIPVDFIPELSSKEDNSDKRSQQRMLSPLPWKKK